MALLGEAPPLWLDMLARRLSLKRKQNISHSVGSLQDQLTYRRQSAIRQGLYLS